MRATWNVHKWNAKRRGIPVHWTYFEFALFCSWTGYHLTHGETSIDRLDCLKGYSLENCTVIDFDLNSVKGSKVEKLIHEKRRLRSLGKIID